MSMLKKLFSKKHQDGVVDVEENTQGSKKKKSSKHSKRNNKKEEHQPNPAQGDGHGEAVAQEDDYDSISKASDVSSEHGNGDGEAEQTLNPEAAAEAEAEEEAPKATNSDAEAGKLKHGEEENAVVEQGDAPVEKTVTVIEESRVRVSEEEDSSSAASGEPEARVSPIAEADEAVDFAKPEASPITEVTLPATSAAHRATWWNCCGILDVFVGSK